MPVGRYTFFVFEGAFNTPGSRLYIIKTTLDAGSFYDGRRLSFSLEPSGNITTKLELSSTYEFNRVKFPDRNQQFTAHIGRLKVLAMLNIKFSMTAFVQYNSAVDTVINNIRFRYNPREGNDLYLVYDEGFNMNRHREDPIMPFTSNRTVMLKYNYTFNL